MILRKITLLAVLGGIFLAAATPTPAWAAKWHHVHLAADDTKAAAEWYARYMEGETAKTGISDTAVFGDTLVIIRKVSKSFEGSAGSVVDHIGWSFTDLDAKMKEFEEAGIKILSPARSLGEIKFGFIEDPWGTKIEVMQDAELIGFHHVHLYVTDPEATQKFYASAFGGEIVRYGGFLPAVKYENMWLITQKSKQRAPIVGRSVDHIGWSFPDLDAGIEHLASLGVELTFGPFTLPMPGGGKLRVGFIEDANGVRIEIVEHTAAQPEATTGAE